MNTGLYGYISVRMYIYKIWKDDLCYVGITNDFKQRMSNHKHECHSPNRKDYNKKLYQMIRETSWDDWTKEIIEETDDKTRERYWIELIGNLNKYITTRPRKELDHKRWETDKERLTEIHKEWLEKHKDYNKSYYQKNKEKILKRQKERRLKN